MDIISYPLTPFMTNCYILRDAGEALLVDIGEVTPSVLAAIKGYTVKTVLNTHCHIDHAGGNAEILRITGAELVCHRDEVPLLQSLTQQGSMFGVEVEPSPEPDRYIDAGDSVRVGEATLAVRFAPGHSPGHIVLVGDGFVIGGDVLFQGSIGRTDIWGGDYDQLIDSIRTQMLTLPDETVVYSGHGPATTIGAERRSNPFLANL